MRIDVLGPVRAVDDDGTPVEISRPARRRLLSILALADGRRVSTDALIDRLWPTGAPQTARSSLQMHIAGLRQELGDGLIATEGYGYRLNLSDHELDADTFSSLAADAARLVEERSWERALAAVDAALAMWGEPYDDLAGDDFALPEITRLHELRLGLLEVRAETLLALDKAVEALPELESLVVEHPLRERLWEHLMTARYRMGRHTDALRAFREVSDHLAEAGVEPGERLRRLEQKILLHDPSLTRIRHNLPAELDTFVGRQTELAELTDLLEKNRLVTVTGPGGSGKTRLASRAAAGLLDRFADGVWLVELGPLSDPELVPEEIAGVVGVKPSSDDVLVDLGRALAEEQMLLVLDNCEHLPGRPSRVASALLRAIPDLRILATSRIPLRVPGEVLYEVSGLGTPGETHEGIPGREFDAVELFEDRAARARPSFHVDATNVGAVAQICRRLDGLPLGIELAAARVAGLPLETIAENLDRRFELLTTGAATGPPRHRTLEATTDWSYRLLSPLEQDILRRIAVFRGGFDLEMAATVCGRPGLDGAQIIAIIGQLTDSSLVSMYEEGGRPRHRLLETIRDFALDRLEESDDSHDARRRHLEWCVSFSDDVWSRVHGPGRSDLLDRVHVEFENLTAALEYARESGDDSSRWRLEAGILWHWQDLAHLTRTIELLESALAACDDAPREADMRNLYAWALFSNNDSHGALREARAAYEMLAAGAPSPAKAAAIRRLAALSRLVVDVDPMTAVPLAREAVEVAVAAGDTFSEARGRIELAYALSWATGSEEALHELAGALDLVDSIGDAELALSAFVIGFEVAMMIPRVRREMAEDFSARIVELARTREKYRHYHTASVAWGYLMSGDWDVVDELLAGTEGDRHVEGYDKLNDLMVRATLDWMRGDLIAATDHIDAIESVGVHPRWYHDFYPMVAEVAADRVDVVAARRAAQAYVAAEVHTSEEARKLSVLNALTRAEVDRALSTGNHEAPEARSALATMQKILAEHPPQTEGANTLEVYATYLALARAEVSRLDGSDPDLWSDAAERADFAHFRLYARWRLAEALLLRGAVDEGAATLADVHAEAERIGARLMVERVDSTAAEHDVSLR